MKWLFSDNATPPRSAWGYKAWHSSFLVIGVYWFVGFFIAVLIPQDVLHSGEWVRQFVQSVTRIVPSIEPFSRVSSHPQVTAVFLGVMWLLLIPVAVIACLLGPRQPVRSLSGRGVLVVSAMALLLSILVYLFFSDTRVAPGDLSYTLGRGKAFLTLMLGSRLGLATVGSLVMASVSLFLVLIFFTVRHFWIAPIVRLLTGKGRIQ